MGPIFQVLEPLHAAGKLGAVQFQFAPWITSGGESRQPVEHCVGVRYVLEMESPGTGRPPGKGFPRR